MEQKIWDFKYYKNNIAFKDEHGNNLTYLQLENEGNKLAEILGGRRLVFILCSNSIGAAFGYAAFLNNHIVPVMLNDHLEEELLNSLMDIYKPPYLWVGDDRLTQFNNMICVYKLYGYSLLKTDYESEYPLYENLALLLTTSGSTGSPKFVRQSYENILDNTKSIVEYLNLSVAERPITTLPMSYTYGLSIINTHLYVGATILLTDKGLMQKGFWDFFKSEKATSFGGVPYTYEMLDKLHFYKMDLPSLKTMTQAGGKITTELHKKFADYAKEKNKSFVVMYGQCEATARMGYLPAEKASEKMGSMGVAIPGGIFRLIDSDGQEISQPGIAGELVYEGANVTLGYAERGEDLILKDERNGILYTGDVAKFDEDGYYYIVGRMKRFLKIYGNRVNLDEMERLIKGSYDVEVACAGLDDHMYIFLTNKTNAEVIKSFASAKTGLNPVTFTVKIIDEIPKNDSGKTQYKELEKYYERKSVG